MRISFCRDRLARHICLPVLCGCSGSIARLSPGMIRTRSPLQLSMDGAFDRYVPRGPRMECLPSFPDAVVLPVTAVPRRHSRHGV